MPFTGCDKIGAGDQFGSAMSDPLVLTVDQVAALLQVDCKTVMRLRNQKKIAFVKIGGKLRFRMEDVQEYLGKARQQCHEFNEHPGLDRKTVDPTGTSFGTTKIPNGSDDAALALAFAARLKKNSDAS